MITYCHLLKFLVRGQTGKDLISRDNYKRKQRIHDSSWTWDLRLPCIKERKYVLLVGDVGILLVFVIICWLNLYSSYLVMQIRKPFSCTYSHPWFLIRETAHNLRVIFSSHQNENPSLQKIKAAAAEIFASVSYPSYRPRDRNVTKVLISFILWIPGTEFGGLNSSRMIGLL